MLNAVPKCTDLMYFRSDLSHFRMYMDLNKNRYIGHFKNFNNSAPFLCLYAYLVQLLISVSTGNI